MRDDGPGHGRGVDSPDHPEHAEPAQVLPSLLPGQHLCEVREHYGHRTTNPAGGDIVSQQILIHAFKWEESRCLDIFFLFDFSYTEKFVKRLCPIKCPNFRFEKILSFVIF